MQSQKYIIISDYSDGRGGASVVARREFELLSVTHNIKFLAIDKHPLKLFFLNFLLLFYLCAGWKFLIHTWSFFPVLKLLTILKPEKLIFIIHDYLLMCPNKALFNFNKNSRCNLNGYSKSCLTTDCGYNPRKKILHNLFNRLSRTQIKRCQFRFLSAYTKQLFEARYGPLKSSVQPNLTMYDFTPLTCDKQMLLKHSLKRNEYLIFIGRANKDKGYDRFENLVTNFVKVACGPDKSINNDVKNLGWADENTVITLAKNAKAIIYPSRQPDCDPLVQQLSEKFGIPFIVSNNNAATNFAFKNFGKAAVVDEWETVFIDDRVACTYKTTQLPSSRNIAISNFYDQYFS